MGIGIQLRWEGMGWKDLAKQECRGKRRFGWGVVYRNGYMWITYNLEVLEERRALIVMFPREIWDFRWHTLDPDGFQAKFKEAKERYSKSARFREPFIRYLEDFARIVGERPNVMVRVNA